MSSRRPRASEPEAATAPARRPVAVAVVGLGFGANHARVLHELSTARLAAVCDADRQRLAAVADRYGVPAYHDYAEMLQVKRPDALVVATPARLHEEVALAAMALGCAVLVEKPLAPKLSGGLRLARAATAAGVTLMPGHIERFNPALRELAARVRAGELGRVIQLSARRSGAIRQPPADVNVVHDSALHDIDAMRFVLGAEVEQVYAGAQSGVVTPLENGLQAVLRFEPADGQAVTGSLEVSWLSPRRLRDLSVLGEKGLLALDYAAQTLDFYETPARRSGPVQGWSLGDGGEPAARRIAVEPREQLLLELSAFVEAVREESAPPVTPEDGLAALAVADALTRSARTGQSVRPRRWSLLD